MKFGSKEHMDYLEKYVNEPLRNNIKEMDSEKKDKVLGSWKDYKKFYMDIDYTLEEENFSERERVKFYRAKEIYSKIMNKLDYKECDDCIYSFIDGYCLGVRADDETKNILYWLLRKDFFREA
jgi:hypothetical protein